MSVTTLNIDMDFKLNASTFGVIKAHNVGLGAMKLGGKRSKQKRVGRVPMPLQYVHMGKGFVKGEHIKTLLAV